MPSFKSKAYRIHPILCGFRRFHGCLNPIATANIPDRPAREESNVQKVISEGPF